MLKFLTGAAAIALAATAIHADPGGGKGGGDKAKGGGKGQAEHAQAGPGGGGDKAKGNGNVSRGNKEVRAQANVDRGPDKDRGSGQAKGNSGRGNDDVIREVRGKGRDDDVRVLRDRDRDVRVVRDDRGRIDWDDFVPDRSRGLIAGCPPGLAKKNNGCMPPGQARKAALGFIDRPDWWDLDGRWFDNVNWNDGRYRYMDGYLVRYDNDGIDAWLPLLGGALAPGNVWPSYYQSSALPPYYQDYYGLGSASDYRYYDDALFRLDPQTQAITAIAGLLTGDSIGIGQPLPLGYDVYNVPYSYRDQYVDGPDAYYRYSDGYVYEVDPTTQLVQAAIQLLT